MSVPGGNSSQPQNGSNPNGGSSSSSSSSSSTPVTTIIGAAVGGLVALAAIATVVWWSCFRHRKQPRDQEAAAAELSGTSAAPELGPGQGQTHAAAMWDDKNTTKSPLAGAHSEPKPSMLADTSPSMLDSPRVYHEMSGDSYYSPGGTSEMPSATIPQELGQGGRFQTSKPS